MTEDFLHLNDESLDPEDWESIRQLGHRMVDDMLDYLQNLDKLPAWQHAPEQVKAHLTSTPPSDPQSPMSVYEEYLKFVHP